MLDGIVGWCKRLSYEIDLQGQVIDELATVAVHFSPQNLELNPRLLSLTIPLAPVNTCQIHGQNTCSTAISVRSNTRIPHDASCLVFMDQVSPEDVQDCREARLG